jgi:uncharacterized protein (TIGR03084 family)
MAVELAALLSDLEQESLVVDRLLSGLKSEQWRLPTPAEGWSIGDQVSHLAYFDEAATLAAVDPGRFRIEADRLMAQGPDFTTLVADRFRSLTSVELLDWFRQARARYLGEFARLDPATKLPWYGPPMSAASSATARLMETWAHGLDIADAIGADVPPTMRLRHIAHLGVRTFGFAFQIHGLEIPDTAVRVELTAPDRTTWSWGDPAAAERVTGPALDFCLVVTQRRHLDDTSLIASGPVASQWLSVAQAFAGPPGAGRPSTRQPHDGIDTDEHTSGGST